MIKNNKTSHFIISGSVEGKVTTKNAVITSIDNELCNCSIEPSTADTFQIGVNKKTFEGEIVSLHQNRCTVLINGNTYQINIDSEQIYERKKRLAKTEEVTITRMKAPLPGKVCDILVSEQMQVKTGDPLLILEAMKMHNEICSPATGVVTKIHIKADDAVSGDQLLIEINTAETAP